MIKYVDCGQTIFDRETYRYIPKNMSNRLYRQYIVYKLEGGQIIPRKPNNDYVLVGDAWVIADETVAERKLESVNRAFRDSIKKPVECTYSGGTLEMDGLEDSAVKMRRGIEFATKLGIDKMDLIDYHNNVHEGISLEDAEAIMLQQAASFYALYMERAKARAALLNS